MGKPLRVLHLDTGREMRGGQWQAFLLMKELNRRGVAQALLAPGGSPLLERAHEAGMAAGPLSLVSFYRQSRPASLIHAHDARAHALGALAGKPLVVSRRVAFGVRRSLFSRWKYRRASLYLAVSEYVKNQLTAAGIAAGKIAVVYDGVELPELAEGVARNRITALASGDALKGNGLIRSAAKRADVEVWFSDDLERDLPRAAVFVYISESEGLGSAALLAMAYGVPVVASRVGGLPEAVEDGRTGILVSNDEGEIASAIRKLADDPVAAAGRGALGRMEVRERFSLERLAINTLNAYERIL